MHNPSFLPPAPIRYAPRSNFKSPVFASKYRTVLPTEAELIAELERERRVIEQKQNGGDT